MKKFAIAFVAAGLLAFAGSAMAENENPGTPQGNAYGKNGCASQNGSTTGATPGKYFQAQADARTDGNMNELLGGDGWLRADTNLGNDNPSVVADWINRDCSAEAEGSAPINSGSILGPLRKHRLRGLFLGLLRPEALDRIEAGGAARRIVAEEYADGAGEEDRRQHGLRRQEDRPAG